MPAGGALVGFFARSAWFVRRILLRRIAAAADNKKRQNSAENTGDHVVLHRDVGLLLSPRRFTQVHSVETPRRMSSPVLYNLSLFLWRLWLAVMVFFA